MSTSVCERNYEQNVTKDKHQTLFLDTNFHQLLYTTEMFTEFDGSHSRPSQDVHL